MEEIARWYRDFAAVEARGVSPLYEELALGVAGDDELLDLLAGLPEEKRQPNLLLAAARYVAGLADGYPAFRRSVLAHRAEVVATMRDRRTQTNEPARCAAVYPLLAALPQPVALVEAGAAAGLCLLPDRYRYEYDGRPAGDPSSPVLLRCDTGGTVGQPGRVTVAWRAGIDLNPLDVTDPDTARWLSALVWPGRHDREERLRAAIDVARRYPPRIVPGDVTERLAAVAAQAPPDATLVVFHTAVLPYLDDAGRHRFVDRVRALGAHWIAQEGPGVVPDLAAPQPPPDRPAYVVALDGRPVAFSAPHGGWLRWLA